MKLGWKRLLKLADILDVADAEHRAKGEPRYRQSKFAHACGSPACALGHYAAHNRRRGWRIGLTNVTGTQWALVHGQAIGCAYPSVLKEFELTKPEAAELFAADGCSDARTAKQAAKYIRAFVKRKQAEAP